MALEKTFDAKSAEKRIYENWEKKIALEQEQTHREKKHTP